MAYGYKRKRTPYRRARTFRRRRAPVRRAVAAVRRRAFEKRVQAVVSKNNESKYTHYSSPDDAGYGVLINSVLNSQGDVMPIIPRIDQGVSNGERIGNQLKIQSLRLKGYARLNYQASPGAGPWYLHIFIVTPKEFPTYTQAYANYNDWLSEFSLLGNSAPTFWQGDLKCPLRAVNRNVVTVHSHKVIKMSMPAWHNSSALPTNPTSDMEAAPDRTVYFNIPIKCKGRVLKYANDGEMLPTSFSPVVLFAYSNSTSVADSLTTRCSIFYTVSMFYEDA